jgi:steroid delta-isomerase
MGTVAEEVARTYFAALADGKNPAKIDEWVALFADDAVMTDPVTFPQLPADVHQHSQVGAFVSGFFANFKSIGLFERYVITNEGDSAAVAWEGIGVGNNGKSVTFHGIDVITVNQAGKIQTVFAFWDPAPVLKEIGAA